MLMNDVGERVFTIEVKGSFVKGGTDDVVTGSSKKMPPFKVSYSFFRENSCCSSKETSEGKVNFLTSTLSPYVFLIYC